MMEQATTVQSIPDSPTRILSHAGTMAFVTIGAIIGWVQENEELLQIAFPKWKGLSFAVMGMGALWKLMLHLKELYRTVAVPMSEPKTE
jgi:hypothetical protein